MILPTHMTPAPKVPFRTGLCVAGHHGGGLPSGFAEAADVPLGVDAGHVPRLGAVPTGL